MTSSGFLPCTSGVSALPVFATASFLPSRTSHAQPLPNWLTAACLKASRNLSKPPRAASIMSFSGAAGDRRRRDPAGQDHGRGNGGAFEERPAIEVDIYAVHALAPLSTIPEP